VLTGRGSLHALQCPRCELRFAFTSELEQHLRLDHQPPKAASRLDPEPVTNVPQDETPMRLSAAETTRLNRFIVWLIVTAAVVVFVSVLSWRAAALVTVAALGGAALRGTIRARSRNKQAQL
jgi:hypothetical protein